MKPGVAPNVVSPLKPFHQSTLQCLEDQPSGSFSGVSKDGSYCWVVRGSQLEVLDTGTRDRLGAWQFGKVLGDQHTNVTCVEEFLVGHSPKLLVGVCNASPTGLLCMFNVAQSKVIKAIEIPHQVTELEVVCVESRSKMPRWALSEQLRYFSGLVAVGTAEGHVYLVDMALDDSEFFSDEEVPSKVHFISPRNRDIENQRFHCMSQGLHLSMALNEGLFTRQGFEYQKPDGIVMKTFQSERISVSCLQYVPQIGILVVGYSFGCFQLWKLSIPTLEYSSRLEFEQMQVTHVAYQEPENDPKNFCYLWVARGHGVTDEELETVSNITMYQMTFNHKDFYSGYGVFYDELATICERLSHELTNTPVQYGSNFEGVSRIVACYTLTDSNYQPPVMLPQDESFEESSHAPDVSLCVFVWEVLDSASPRASKHLAVFDINRWYHAQMPGSVRYVSGSTERCSYFSFCRLDEAAEQADYENLLGVHVLADRLRKFVSTSVIPPDQHFYPASLAFDVKLVFEVGVVETQFMGAQRQVLANLEKLGARALVQPQDLHSLCVYVGLLPQPLEGGLGAHSVTQLREALLSMALDYNQVAFLKSCILQWSSGEYEHQGCSLKMLIDWLWEKVSATKHHIDTICVSLYNWSGLGLDQRSLQTLQQCDRRLKHLTALLQVFIQTTATTEQGALDLQSKLIVTGLLSLHLNLVLWFVGAKLLPERDDTEEASVGTSSQFCYPVTGLTEAYRRRRSELQQIHSDVKEEELLMIDGLVEFLGVGDVWEREGGTRLYPPPSLHALLSSYLLENVDSLSKHCVVLYMLLDLVSLDSLDDNSDFSEKVLGFAQRFSMPHTLVKCIQAFWLLDHRDFEEALALMLDPLVTAEFSRWQHSRVIKALLYQGDARMALRYITSIKPALTTPEEVKLKLTVLLANGMTAEALEYQRMCRDQNNSHDLLTHLFLGCQQTHTVDRLLQLPLSLDEEAGLVEYLGASGQPGAQELLVMHYLQRARFIEAIQLNEKLKHMAMVDANPKARERAAARNAIVDSFARLLPSVQRKLMFEQARVPNKASVTHQVCARPTPLSTKITQSKVPVMSRSAFILTIIEKLDEIEATDNPRNDTANKSLGPFICTPVTPARKSLRDTPATAYPEPQPETGSAGVTSLGRSLFAFQDGDTPKGMDKRQSRFFSASCMSLLQTPKVQPQKSRTPCKAVSSVITPQSILKIRSITAKMSPSPHSSNTTPNSQELEPGSSRKLPRKLGYGTASKSTTPAASVSFSEPALSSLPRHLATEMSATPQSPRPSTSSQPATPKSVSFADTTFSRAAKMKTLSTPVRPGMESKETDRSTHVESPTSPSIQSLDGSRSSLKTASSKPSAAEEEDNVSDDNVEEMDTAEMSPVLRLDISASPAESHPGEKTPPCSPQKSPTKLASPTVKISKSPVSAFSPKARRESTVEPTSSEAEAAQESAAIAASNGDTQPDTVDLTEDDEMEVESPDTQAFLPAGETSNTEGAHAEIFKEEEEIPAVEEMIEEDGTDLGKVTSSEDDMQNVDLKGTIKQEVCECQSPGEHSRQLQPSPSTSSSPETRKQRLRRKSLTPISERQLQLVSPKISPGSSSSKSDSSPPLSQQDKILQMIDEKFGVSPDHSDVTTTAVVEARTRRPRKPFVIKPVKVEAEEMTNLQDDSEAEKAVDSDTSVENKLMKETLIQEEKVSASDSKLHSEERENPEKPSTSSPTRRSHRKQTEQETQDPVTPTRSTRRLKKSEAEPSTSLAEDEEKTHRRTLTRSARNRAVKQEITEEMVEISAKSPTKFSQSAKEIVQESLIQISENMKLEMEASPGHMTKIKSKDAETALPVTPTRSSRRGRKSETPTRDMVEEIVDPDIGAADGALKTPPRTRRTRKTASSASPESSRGNISDFENVSPKSKSPSCSQKNDSNSAQLRRTTMDTSELARLVQVKRTPTRGRKKKESSVEPESIDSDIGTKSELSAEAEQDISSSNRQSFERSEIPFDFLDESVETTPSRRRSLPRSCKVDLNSLPRTPTRRQSLAQSAKLLKEEVKSLDGDDSAHSSPVRTPSRRGRSKKTETTGLEEIVENEQLVLTPSRRGRSKQTENEDIENTYNEETLQPSTPSRRGKSKKSEAPDENEPVTPSRRGRVKKTIVDNEENQDEIEPQPATPSRRGRSKKTVEPENTTEMQEEPSTPSRRGRSKKTEVESEEVSESESLPLTPSRRGRSRKTVATVEKKPAAPSRRGRSKKNDSSEMEVTSEEETQAVTPSRRGRKTKTETSDMEVTLEEESKPGRGRSIKVEMSVETEDDTQPATPSRRGRSRKADKYKQAEDEMQALTPSRSKRAKKEKGSPSRGSSAGNGAGSPPRVSNAELFDIQSASFQFSGPTLVDEGSPTPAKSFTPSKSFIFSPPVITSTQESLPEKTKQTGILLPPGETEASAKEGAKKATKKRTTKKSRKLYTEKDEVLLISPLAVGKDDSGSEGRDIITRTTRSGRHKVQTQVDGTQLMLRSLGVKPKRTSHRFGPVGKKKTQK